MSSAASALTSSQVRNEVDMAVARKTLNSAKAQGAAVASLLDEASQLQQAMVTKAISEPHKGNLIDVLA